MTDKELIRELGRVLLDLIPEKVPAGQDPYGIKILVRISVLRRGRDLLDQIYKDSPIGIQGPSQ